MYRSLLVPLDGSTFAEHALGLAIAVAERAEARLRLVLVHTPLVVDAADLAPVEIGMGWAEAHREREHGYLERQAERLRARGHDVDIELRDGHVGTEVAEVAASSDLVVMATHGRGGLARAWLGSVADHVVRHVTRPVLVVRPGSTGGGARQRDGEPERPDDEPVSNVEHVLAATDGSEAADRAVRHAAEMARLFDARLTILRIVAFPAGLASPYIPHAAEMDRDTVADGVASAERAVEALAREIEGVEVETVVETAFQPARGILEAAREVGCDLLAVGTHRRTVVGRAILGSTADKVIRATTVPVLVAHDEG